MPGNNDFFTSPRGEREYYAAAFPTEPIRLPLTRDGFEAMLEVSVNQFDPPLPIDDSIRSVFAGYVHHMKNEENTTSIEQISKVLYKSISNALTWTIDQEVKALAKAQATAAQEKIKAEELELQKQGALASAELKRQKKSSKKLTVIEKRQ